MKKIWSKPELVELEINKTMGEIDGGLESDGLITSSYN
jgi:hypothetical protein